MRKISIAFIDDSSPYSRNLYLKIISDNRLHFIYYAPKGLVGKISLYHHLPNTKRVWTSHFYPLQIVKEVARDKPDIVHIQFELNTFGPHYTSLLILPLLVLLRVMRRKVLVTVHTVISRHCFAGAFTDSIIPSMFKVLHIPAWFYEIVLSMIYSFVGWFSDALIVHTATQRQYLVSHYNVNEKKVFVIPQGVDYTDPVINYEKIQLWKKKLGKEKVVLYFGTITPIKGLEWLIRSFSRLFSLNPECVLTIVGGLSPYYKNYFNRLKGLASELNLRKKVFFTGWLDSEDLNALFSLANIVVFPYIFPHASSGTLAMAKKHQKHIIASDVEILKEQLSDYDKVVFVPLEDEKSLAETMLSMISPSSKEARSKLGNLHVDSWDCVAMKTILLYCRLIGLALTNG